MYGCPNFSIYMKIMFFFMNSKGWMATFNHFTIGVTEIWSSLIKIVLEVSINYMDFQSFTEAVIGFQNVKTVFEVFEHFIVQTELR